MAANRTDSVIGRITLLTISIITRNGIRGPGVLLGTKCAINEDVLRVKEATIVESQRTIARVKLNVICLDLVNT